MSPTQSLSNWEAITPRRAQVLTELERNFTEDEISRRLHVSPNTVHRHVQVLRDLTDCRSGRELGRWWRDNRKAWLNHMQMCAGLDDDD